MIDYIPLAFACFIIAGIIGIVERIEKYRSLRKDCPRHAKDK